MRFISIMPAFLSHHAKRSPLWRTRVKNVIVPLLVIAWLITACDGNDATPSDAGPSDAGPSDAGPSDAAPSEANDASTTPPAPGTPTARILSAYHGLDRLDAVGAPNPAAIARCGPNVGEQDGMPVVFSVQVEHDSLSDDAFIVETADGTRVTPACVVLAPALEALERRTALLVGPFGSPEAHPRAVEVVGPIRDLEGNSLQGLRTEEIVPLSAGPSVVLAERFDPSTPGLVGECPSDTVQVVHLTWDGGVSGPSGADFAEPQRNGISITLANGELSSPTALADDGDNDNHVLVCLDDMSPATSVSVDAGLFHDPADDPNPITTIDIVNRAP